MLEWLKSDRERRRRIEDVCNRAFRTHSASQLNLALIDIGVGRDLWDMETNLRLWRQSAASLSEQTLFEHADTYLKHNLVVLGQILTEHAPAPSDVSMVSIYADNVARAFTDANGFERNPTVLNPKALESALRAILHFGPKRFLELREIPTRENVR
ncbi:MAG: hypothetical protein AAGA32_00360 [Pseudomonadota bacterium]